jgi:hypothetical protein
MKQGKDFGLGFGQEVDQEVPARNAVQTRERRIGQNVLHREDDTCTQLGRDPVAAIFHSKEASQPCRRDFDLDRLRIETFASTRDGLGIDVARENLQFDLALRFIDLLAQQHGEGVGLLAGTAAGDPDSQRPIQRMITHEAGNDVAGKKIEDRRIAEETRHIDQHIRGKLIEFDRIPTEEFEISFGGLGRRHRHPALGTALECSVLVEREIVGRLLP